MSVLASSAVADINETENGCAELEVDPSGTVDDHIPTAGTVRALFIFARFKDDNRHDWGNDWPIDPLAVDFDELPSWADGLLEDTAGSGTPQVEGSLAHYFWLMSRGTFRVDAVPFPQVVVLDTTIAEYRTKYPGYTTEALDYAARHAIERVAATDFDLSLFASGTPGYTPCHPENPGAGIALGSVGQSARLGEGHGGGEGSNVGADEAPSRITRTEVGDVVPSPTRGGVTLTLRVRFGAVENIAIDAFDVRGRRIRDVLRTRLGSGEYRLAWDARDSAGSPVGAGAYFLRVRVGDRVETRKVLVLR